MHACDDDCCTVHRRFNKTIMFRFSSKFERTNFYSVLILRFGIFVIFCCCCPLALALFARLAYMLLLVFSSCSFSRRLCFKTFNALRCCSLHKTEQQYFVMNQTTLQNLKFCGEQQKWQQHNEFIAKMTCHTLIGQFVVKMIICAWIKSKERKNIDFFLPRFRFCLPKQKWAKPIQEEIKNKIKQNDSIHTANDSFGLIWCDLYIETHRRINNCCCGYQPFCFHQELFYSHDSIFDN